MEDRDKTKDQLLSELAALRHRVAELEAAEAQQRQVEQALRESEGRFRKSFDTESVAMAISRRRDGMYLEANPGFLKMTGYEYDEIVGHTSQELDFLSPTQRQKLVADLGERGRLHNQELTFPAKDGKLRTILFSIAPLTISNEDCILATMVDITERKQAEEALSESEAKIRSIFRAAPAGIGLVSDRVLLDVNDRLCEITGYRRDDLIGHSARMLYPTDRDYETVGREKYRQIEEQGTGTVETRFQRKDGRIIDVLLSSTPLDTANLSAGVTFTVLDITDLKQAEEALRESDERFRMTIQRSPIGVGIVDREGRLTDCNAALAEIVGYSREELVRLTFEDFTHPDDLEREWRLINRLWSEETTQYRMEKRYIHRDGHIIWVDVAASLFKDEMGGLAFGFAFVQDITERRRAEQALRRTTERLQIQREIDRAILSAQSAEEIAYAALVCLQDLIPCRRTSVAEIDLAQQRGRDLLFLVEGEPRGRGMSWYPLSGVGQEAMDAIQRGEAHLVPDIAALEAPSHMERLMADLGVRAYVSVPLVVQHTLIGALNMSSERPDFFTPGHIEILEEVADSLAIALQQARLLEQTRRDAETRSLLLREVNHRVLNNLTMIQSILDMERRRPLGDEADFHAALRDVASRIEGMTIVHRLLSSAQWAPVDLADVVEEVIYAVLRGSSVQSKIEVQLDAPRASLLVSSRQAIAVALVVNELTTNSVKYAFGDEAQGRIDVQIEAEGEGRNGRGVCLTFRDDGPGLPDEVLAGERHNVGLWLVAANAEHSLGGEVSLHNDDGAVVSITFERAPFL